MVSSKTTLKILKSLGLSITLAALGCGGSGLLGIQPDVIYLVGDQYSSRNTLVDAGSTIRWQNLDGDLHTVTADIAGKGPNSDSSMPDGIPANGTFVFNVPSSAASGTEYYYHCRFHGAAGNGTVLGNGMSGVLVVR